MTTVAAAAIVSLLAAIISSQMRKLWHVNANQDSALVQHSHHDVQCAGSASHVLLLNERDSLQLHIAESLQWWIWAGSALHAAGQLVLLGGYKAGGIEINTCHRTSIVFESLRELHSLGLHCSTRLHPFRVCTVYSAGSSTFKFTERGCELLPECVSFLRQQLQLVCPQLLCVLL